MCTSNVAGNTQMASLDRQVTQNGLGVNNAIAREYTMVSARLTSVAMMRSGVVDVDPFLISRNTLGNGKTTNSKSQMSNVKMVVAGCGGGMMCYASTQCGNGV